MKTLQLPCLQFQLLCFLSWSSAVAVLWYLWSQPEHHLLSWWFTLVETGALAVENQGNNVCLVCLGTLISSFYLLAKRVSVLFINLSLFSNIRLGIWSVSSQYLLNKWVKKLYFWVIFPKKNFKHATGFFKRLKITWGRRNVWMHVISHQVNTQIIRLRTICPSCQSGGCCLSSGYTVDKPRRSAAETQGGQTVQ